MKHTKPTMQTAKKTFATNELRNCEERKSIKDEKTLFLRKTVLRITKRNRFVENVAIYLPSMSLATYFPTISNSILTAWPRLNS